MWKWIILAIRDVLLIICFFQLVKTTDYNQSNVALHIYLKWWHLSTLNTTAGSSKALALWDKEQIISIRGLSASTEPHSQPLNREGKFHVLESCRICHIDVLLCPVLSSSRPTFLPVPLALSNPRGHVKSRMVQWAEGLLRTATSSQSTTSLGGTTAGLHTGALHLPCTMKILHLFIGNIYNLNKKDSWQTSGLRNSSWNALYLLGTWFKQTFVLVSTKEIN